MTRFARAKWIWVENNSIPDTYGEFYDDFIWNEGVVNCLLSCDSDYTLFVNGTFVASNQYGDYEWYKVYDTIDITKYLQKGKNAIAVLVWHFGMDSQRYLKADAGLIFEVQANDKVLLASSENTRARYSKAYKHSLQKLITSQLGFSFCYDATQEDAWTISGDGFHAAVTVDKKCTFVKRPIKN